MTNQHQATPDDWAQQEDWANRSAFSDSSCIIELRDRIKALEATQHAHIDTSHLTDAEQKQIREDLARPATFAELLMPPPRTATPVPLFTAEEVARIVAPQDKLDRLIALDRDDPAEAAAQQPLAFTGKVVAPITRDRDETGNYLIVHDTPAPTNSLVERIATDAELCQVYNEKTTLRAVYDLGREHGAAPIRSGPKSPPVERVADAIAAQATSAGIVNVRPARAAILEVAAWLKEEGYSTLQAEALAQEANQ
jgi:hypothetical protein